jgi:hypothetical protein
MGMVKFNILTSAEMISLKQLISGTHVARIDVGHAEKLRSLGFTEMKRGEAVVTESGQQQVRIFTGSHLGPFL